MMKRSVGQKGGISGYGDSCRKITFQKPVGRIPARDPEWKH